MSLTLHLEKGVMVVIETVKVVVLLVYCVSVESVGVSWRSKCCFREMSKKHHNHTVTINIDPVLHATPRHRLPSYLSPSFFHFLTSLSLGMSTCFLKGPIGAWMLTWMRYLTTAPGSLQLKGQLFSLQRAHFNWLQAAPSLICNWLADLELH